MGERIFTVGLAATNPLESRGPGAAVAWPAGHETWRKPEVFPAPRWRLERLEQILFRVNALLRRFTAILLNTIERKEHSHCFYEFVVTEELSRLQTNSALHRSRQLFHNSPNGHGPVRGRNIL